MPFDRHKNNAEKPADVSQKCKKWIGKIHAEKLPEGYIPGIYRPELEGFLSPAKGRCVGTLKQKKSPKPNGMRQKVETKKTVI